MFETLMYPYVFSWYYTILTDINALL